MSLIVAIQMDPIDAIDINADSTFALALEAQKRGYQLYHYLPKDLSLDNGKAMAVARKLTVQNIEREHFTLGNVEWLDLASLDVVLLSLIHI